MARRLREKADTTTMVSNPISRASSGRGSPPRRHIAKIRDAGGGKSGNNVTIAVPNDATNEARALMLLEANGYIKLKDGVSITATVRDIEDSNGIEFEEVEAVMAEMPLAVQTACSEPSIAARDRASTSTVKLK